ncbi:MAG: hypothetical protein LBD06_13470 [Candidatus Accumulibacter sp.]|nr:hypothetical protein [Accumulibacter sp.]
MGLRRCAYRVIGRVAGLPILKQRFAENKGYIWAERDNDLSVFVQHQTDQYTLIHSATQAALWINENQKFPSGFPESLFLLLLQHFGCILSDKVQTEDGQKFWKRQLINFVLDRAHYIYYVDWLDHTLLPITQHRVLLDYLEKAWGWGPEFAKRRFLISTKAIYRGGGGEGGRRPEEEEFTHAE